MLISPQWVVVDKLQGTIWEGSFTGRVLAQIDGGDALNGSFVLQDMNLTAIGKSYGEKMEKATVHGAVSYTHLVVTDGNLITGQDPFSSEKMAETVMNRFNQ